LVQKPVITSIQLLDKEIGIPSSGELEFNYKQNFFTLEFSSFPFLYKDRIEYASKLTGVNDDWIVSQSKNYADYTDLQGGSYDFQIKARVDGSAWSDVTHLKITIAPPYWKTWWFRILVILIVAGIVYGIYWYRLNQLKKMQQVRNSISSDLHDDVGASLSSINIYSKVAMERMQASPETVNDLLNQINKNASETMDRMSDIVWSINPNNDTLQSLFNRIKVHCMEVLQASDMEVHYVNELNNDMHIGMNARKNIFLIAKEIINNAAKYSEASELNISVQLKNDTLILLFSDNGKGIQQVETKGGNGFRNMRNRVTELQGEIAIESEIGLGTKITIHLPVARIREAK
jgi:two-component sensor histidine kinase